MAGRWNKEIIPFNIFLAYHEELIFPPLLSELSLLVRYTEG